jgi:uncharacterized protein YecE (DUF72 family)
MDSLSIKNLAFLIQLPSSLTIGENGQGLKDLKSFFSILDNSKGYRYAIEFRDSSWFNDRVWEILRDYNVCMVWNQLDNLIAPPPVYTTDFVYLRLIGDSNRMSNDIKLEMTVEEGNQTKFLAEKYDDRQNEKIKNDSLAEMEYWAKELIYWSKKRVKNKNQSNPDKFFAAISINNFFMGYCPSAINTFRRMLGLPHITLNDKNQTTLFDFQNLA